MTVMVKKDSYINYNTISVCNAGIQNILAFRTLEMSRRHSGKKILETLKTVHFVSKLYNVDF